MSGAPQVSVEVVRTLDQLTQVYALRGIVYVGEQECPFAEEFDGNDLSGATHLLARIGGEPVGAVRIRWFAGFAKLERAAVAPRHRDSGVARALWQASAEMAARKGYRHILGHIEPRLLDFWENCAGFRPRAGRAPFRFSDRDYIEVIAETPACANAIDLDAPPLVLLRPEGAWDEAGVLDASAARGTAAGRLA
ncbi:GNAT family N-acetyltransferase [Terricaulis sp.]|uniref:GNAT family N-acetyltransferase n=1 Tax=Terricaulis sp. TaxID=2768686 RepID=UPI003783738A